MDRTRPTNPFPGPRPFERKEQAQFFGRFREVKELTSMVISNQALLLYSSSGAGKTSLINAALIPALESEEDFDILPVARVGRTRSLPPPPPDNVYIFNLLAFWADTSAGGSFNTRHLRTSEVPVTRPARNVQPTDLHIPPVRNLTLNDFLADRPVRVDANGMRSPRAIVFDQFEELLFAYPEYWRHRSRFFEQVSEALVADSFLRVVFVIREEYLAELERFGPFLPDGLHARFHLERLNYDAALAAITQPLRSRGRHFSPGVAERIVRDLLQERTDGGLGESIVIDGEYIEPVQLQIMCVKLWNNLPADIDEITVDHVQSCGNVDEVLSAFYSHAIRAAAVCSGKPERDLRIWFQDAFVTSLGTRSTVCRTLLTTGGIPNEAVDELEARRLIRVEWRSGAQWYELTHDRLIGPILRSNAKFVEPAGLGAEREARTRASRALAKAEVAWLASRRDEALAYEASVIAIYEELGDEVSVGHTLLRLAELRVANFDLDDARRLTNAALDVYRELDDKVGVADSLRFMAWIGDALGEDKEPFRLLNESLELYDAAGFGDGSARALLALSVLYENRGDFGLALQLSEEALVKLRKSRDQEGLRGVLTRLGSLYRVAGRPHEAVRCLAEAFEIYVNLGDAVSAAETAEQMGDIYVQQGDFLLAVDCFTDAIGTISGDPHLYMKRGGALWYGELNQEAVLDYSRAVEGAPDDPEGYAGRGRALVSLARYAEALADLDGALELYPDDWLRSEIKCFRGVVFAESGRFEDALGEFAESLALDPAYPLTRYYRGIAYWARGNIAEAEVDLRQYLDARTLPGRIDERARALLEGVLGPEASAT